MKYRLGLLEHDPEVFWIRDYGSGDQDRTKIYHDCESILESTTLYKRYHQSNTHVIHKLWITPRRK